MAESLGNSLLQWLLNIISKSAAYSSMGCETAAAAKSLQSCPTQCDPRDSPGKNTGVGCHFLLRDVKLVFPNQLKTLIRLFLQISITFLISSRICHSLNMETSNLCLWHFLNDYSLGLPWNDQPLKGTISYCNNPLSTFGIWQFTKHFHIIFSFNFHFTPLRKVAIIPFSKKNRWWLFFLRA